MSTLGQPLRSFGIHWIQVFSGAALLGIIVGVVVGAVTNSTLDQTNIRTAALFVGIICGIGVFLLHIQTAARQERFVLYESGVRVIQHKVERDFLFKDIDGMTSGISIRFLGGGYGTITFTSDGKRAFVVEPSIQGAMALVDYIRIKMTSNATDDIVRSYKEKGSISIPPLWIGKDGIRSQKESLAWDNIQRFMFKQAHDQLDMLLISVLEMQKSKSRYLDRMIKPNAYSLMCLLDATQSTRYAAEACEKVLTQNSQQTGLLGNVVLIGAFALTLVLPSVIPSIRTLGSDLKREIEVAILTSRFGDVSSLCTSAIQSTAVPTDITEPRYLFIDSITGLTHPITNGLPESQRATSAADLNTVICVRSVETQLDTCSFWADQPANGDREQFFVGLYRRDLELWAVDTTSRTLLGETALQGTTFQCPTRVENRNNLAGAPPTTEDVIKWLKTLRAS
jgi:hypothetical protein